MNKVRRKKIEQLQVELLMVAQTLEAVAHECDGDAKSEIQQVLKDIQAADGYLDDARD